MTQTTYRKKLIEVALPLEAINKASAREKSIRHGHPSTLHLWWARRPLAACRAVLFSSLVNDPEDDPMYGIDEDTAYTERAKLFDLIEELVLWENSNNPTVINRARLEIARSIAANKVADKELTDDAPLVANAPALPEEQSKYLPDPPPEYTAHAVRFKMPSLKAEQVNHFLAHYAPPVLDPFAGGGSIPLEAQRLGLRANASDLNPVPVLINKALIEIPPKFAGQPPVNPDAQKGRLKSKQWNGAEGLAEDVRYYGKWMRDEAKKRVGHLYPKVEVTQQMVDDGRPDLEPFVGQELTVIAWLWARTVKCPSPACARRMPMLGSFWLSKKLGKEAHVEPILDPENNTVVLRVRRNGKAIEETTNRKMARCLFCGNVMKKAQLREQASGHGMSEIPVAVVAETNRGRVYIDASAGQVNLDRLFIEGISQDITNDKRWFSPPQYGLPTYLDLFTSRQLMTLTTYCGLVQEVTSRIRDDAVSETHAHAEEYANAIATYLGLATSKLADYNSSLVVWSQTRDQAKSTFGRQALPMVWDFAEINPFAGAAGDFETSLDGIRKVIPGIGNGFPGLATQADARVPVDSKPVICTDPPYYDNIGYADLSDFFYVWLRHSLQANFPQTLGTMLTPKADELIAAPYRHNGSKAKAAEYFEDGLGDAIAAWRKSSSAEYPLTIFYAFKQSETDQGGTASTGWETFLAGIIEHGFAITATWPVRTERSVRNVAIGTNALASSIVLACVPRETSASMVTRRDFANALRKELPEAIKHLQSGNVAPVDLAQASIGPGMAVFSRYSRVVNADGSLMSVREALQLINQVLDESLVEQESDFDSETRFALRWFEQYGMQEGAFGDAETLAKAMAVSVRGVEEAGIAQSGAGKVRLLKREELDPAWDPKTDTRLTMWEVTQYLIHRLETGGEMAAAELVRDVSGERGEIAKELAYRLYQTCDRKKWADEALCYNAFVASWPEIVRLSRQTESQPIQTEAF